MRSHSRFPILFLVLFHHIVVIPSVALYQEDHVMATSTAPRPPSPAPETDLSAGDMIYEHLTEAPLSATNQECVKAQKIPSHERHGNTTQGTTSPVLDESAEARLERLGRQRPEVFNSIYAEIGFVFSISMSQVLSVSRASKLLRLIR